MIWIGTSGWVYPHWIGNFYPAGMPEREFLAFYARHFETVEINRSFYRLPSRENFVVWAGQVDPTSRFCFAVKGSRFITHFKKLKDPAGGVDRLMSAVVGLGNRLGPLLFQFPPNWKANPERLSSFVGALPPGHRVAFEFRHPSWLSAEILGLLDASGCTSVYAVGGEHPTPFDLPLIGGFRYVRIHGGAHGVGLSDDELMPWAERLAQDRAVGRDAFVYFNNDPGGQAVRDAERLRAMLEASA